MTKQDYRDMWVFLEQERGQILPVSLELLCEARKLCDAAGEKLWAVAVGELNDREAEKVRACGTDRILRVTGSGYEPFNVDAYTELFTRLCRKYRPSAVLVGGTIRGRV